MPMTTLPPGPSRSSPGDFSVKADALVAALPGFVTEANLLELNVETAEANTAADAISTAADAVTCAEKSAIAVASASFKGLWANMVGAANVPYAVSHLNKYWQLASNLADVTAKIPGTDTEWLIIPTAIVWLATITSNTTAVPSAGYLCNTTGAAFTVTLPAVPAEGDIIAFADAAGTFDTKNLTIGRNALNIMGLAEDMIISTKYAAFQLIYASAELGWRIA